jgi:hypothetical protein
VVGLFAVTAVFLVWQRGLDELVAELPADAGPRALRVSLSSLIPCLLATYPALLAWWGAQRALPPSFEAPWWGALLVTYAGCWLLLYAVVEHKWRNSRQIESPSDAGDAT